VHPKTKDGAFTLKQPSADLDWEFLGHHSTFEGHRFYMNRLKVPGGWLYLIVGDNFRDFSTTFVPEPPPHVGAAVLSQGVGITEALAMLEQGKHVRRNTFVEGAYLFKETDGPPFIYCVDGRREVYELTTTDCTALDWELVP
jgi:hypothetical protein